MKQSSSPTQHVSREAPTSALTNIKTMLEQFPHVRTALRLLLESGVPLAFSSVGGKCSPHQKRQNYACLRQLESEGIVTISNSETPLPPSIVIVQGMQDVVRNALEAIEVVEPADPSETKKTKDSKRGVPTKGIRPKSIVDLFPDKKGPRLLFLLYILHLNSGGTLQSELFSTANVTLSTIKPLLDQGLIEFGKERERTGEKSSASASRRVFLSDEGRKRVNDELPAILEELQEQGWVDEDGNL